MNVLLSDVTNFLPAKMPVCEIIKKLMAECRITEAELARQTSLPQTTINRLLLGLTLDPRANTLIPIAKFFGVTIGQLLGQEMLGIDRIPGTYVPTNKNAWHTIPIIEWQEASIWTFQKNKTTPAQYSHWVTTEREVGENSFALRTLEFMQPRFKKNSIIIVDPSYQPKDGVFVVLSINNSDPTVRRIIKDGSDIYLKKLYGSEAPAPLTGQDILIGTIVETRIKEG